MATEEERKKYGNSYLGKAPLYRWPKTKDEQQAQLQTAYSIGKQDGSIETVHKMREDKTAVEPRVLDALVKLATANAQLGDAISKALQSAKGQL